jgi:NAD(P)-dependent dehydrogenase (short-subunit alcohol dehydrogenase family)
LAVTSSDAVVVVTGAGGMGPAVAHRIGIGATVFLADLDDQALESAARSLSANGYDVVSHVVDVSRKDSVEALATDAAARGSVTAVVHTAGVSPVQAPVEAIMRVDLLGTALMLDAFGEVMSPGGAGVFISSMAGTMASLDPDFELRLATTPTCELLDLAELSAGVISDSGTAYAVAKRANQLRVRAASLSWGRRGARVNSISPGVIATPMGASELDGPHGEIMRAMIAASGTGRIGTPEDIAGAVEFLLGPNAGFITGTDLLVDGGVIASLRTPQS